MALMRNPDPSRNSRAGTRGTAAVLVLLAGAGASGADNVDTFATPVMLQWFELSWNRMERRMPDFFMAGYGSTWVAPISKANDPSSPGFDVFDRFDIGKPGGETIYGTEQGFRAAVEQFHRANGLVYVDSVMNHNSGRDGSSGFIASGGYPGFWLGPGSSKTTGSGDWGDFHNGGTQSHDPSGGAGPYNLFEGDLVSLIDINQSSNNQFIRHPVASGNPQNIPAGTIRNKPDPGNARFYPDTGLPPKVVNNPGISRSNMGLGAFNTAPQQFTIYPFNTADPMAGDPIADNATGLLMRWSQWMIDEFGVDGFRLDASKHIEPWFWDQFYDSFMYQRRRAPDGSFVTPFSFGENVEGPSLVSHYWVRKDGFGNRDALDLSNAGDMRNVIGAKGAGSAASLNNNTLDTFGEDGFNNGNRGVRHILSHDNGSRGDGGSAPDYPFEDKIGYWAHAYQIMRPGERIVYHNAREMHDRFVNRGGFWPREGVPTALGFGCFYRFNNYTVTAGQCGGTPPGPSTNFLFSGADDRIPRLVNLSNRYGRGIYIPHAVDGAVHTFTRQTPSGVANVLVGVNDEYNACPTNFDERAFNTAFPQGTVLVELTGNATNPDVDPLGQIPDTITVGASGSVTIRVPRNTSRNGTTHIEHSRGYVVYGPATPNGVLTIVGKSQTLPADSGSVAVFARRLAEVDVVQGASFEINLVTDQTGYPGGDTRFDDTAVFRINQGFVDYNATGSFDVPTGEFRGYEGFVTQRDPIRVNGAVVRANGTYRQTINTDLLPEGLNYISVLAFRDRSSGNEAGGLSLCNDFRRVIYVDRDAPPMELVDTTINCVSQSAFLRFSNPDRTVTSMHVFVNQPVGTLTLQNRATPLDRNEWTFNATGLQPGMNTIRVVALEQPSAGITVNQSTTVFNVDFSVTTGDINGDGVIDPEDLSAFYALVGYQCEADMDLSGVLTDADAALLEALIRQNEGADIAGP